MVQVRLPLQLGASLWTLSAPAELVAGDRDPQKAHGARQGMDSRTPASVCGSRRSVDRVAYRV